MARRRGYEAANDEHDRLLEVVGDGCVFADVLCLRW